MSLNPLKVTNQTILLTINQHLPHHHHNHNINNQPNQNKSLKPMIIQFLYQNQNPSSHQKLTQKMSKFYSHITAQEHGDGTLRNNYTRKEVKEI